MKEKKTEKKKLNVAIIIVVVGMILFTILLFLERINQNGYVGLFLILSFFSLAVYGFPRILEIDFKNLRMILREIKEAKEEVLAKEEDLKKITISLVRSIALINTFQGRIMEPEMHVLNQRWFRAQTENLFSGFEISESIKQDVFKIDKLLNKIDLSDNQEEKKEIVAKIKKLIESEIIQLEIKTE